MANPSDQGFELNGVLFGNGMYDTVIVEDFQPGGFSWRTQDVANPSEDGKRHGRDYLDPSPWSFSLGVNRDNEAQALSTLSQLSNAWDNEGVRAQSGVPDVLRYRINKRTRRVYGRGRNFAPNLDVRRLFGYIGVEATFDRIDALHYGDVEESTTLSLGASGGSGFTTPVITPLTTLNPTTSREGSINVLGDMPAWPVITFVGPVVRPSLALVDGWTLALDGDILAGDTVKIDTRPWHRTVLRNNTYNASGMLSRKTHLPTLTLPSGLRRLVFRGEDVTGTSRATVSWRPAYKSL